MTVTYRVFYAGAPGVGRCTSVASLVARHGGQKIIGRQEYHLPWAPGGPELILRYSSLVTKIWVDEEDPERPQKLRPYLRQLAGIDGIVFVVDSQPERKEHNQGFLRRLRPDLRRVGIDLDTLPVVFQLNKRDIPGGMSVAELAADLQTLRCSYTESIASEGIGTQEALCALLRLIDGRNT